MMGSGHLRSLWPSALLPRAILCVLAIFGLLQVWRPYFFLTDDNLSASLPFLTEVGRHLKSGQSPFYSDYLFGGHYNYLRDANYFGWSPLNFAVSLLADTPGRFAMCDLIALVNLLICTVGFVRLAQRLRTDLDLGVGDGRILFLTLSFIYSTFIITTGASWVIFLGNQAVLPWLALGLWERSWRRSLGTLFFFLLYQALTGHTAATLSNGLIFTLFALVLCLWRRSPQPVVIWIASNIITLAAILPLLFPALSGFFHSQRGAGISVELLHRFNMPAGLVPFSFLFGNFFEMGANLAHIPPDTLAILYFPRLVTLLACAAAWCVFPLVLQRRRWTLLEGGCAVIMMLLLVLVIRPIAITEWMSHVPILRSMRWPFREILQLLFFFHLLLVLRPWGGSPEMQNRIACFSLALFAMPLFYNAPLSLNPLTKDRAALFSGQADRFWSAVKPLLRPGDEIATVIDPDIWYDSLDKPGYALIGTADFPAYFRVPCISGYSQTAPLNQLPIPVRPSFWFGAYDPTQVEAITKNHPEVRVITVSRFTPLKMTLSAPNPGGKPIDLTPYLDPR